MNWAVQSGLGVSRTVCYIHTSDRAEDCINIWVGCHIRNSEVVRYILYVETIKHTLIADSPADMLT